MKDKQSVEERKYEFRKHKEKKGQVKSKSDEELDKHLKDELRSARKDKVKNEECEREIFRKGRMTMLYLFF